MKQLCRCAAEDQRRQTCNACSGEVTDAVPRLELLLEPLQLSARLIQSIAQSGRNLSKLARTVEVNATQGSTRLIGTPHSAHRCPTLPRTPQFGQRASSPSSSDRS